MVTLEEFERGGFGRVDKVRFPDGTVAARKVFAPVPGGTDLEIQRLKARFEREVRFQESLDGDHFMPIIDAALWDDPMWFTMPFADLNLRQQILAWRAEDVVDDMKPFFDVLDGLEILHGMGAVHRDLKPENVLLYQGIWRLIDFGLVLHRDPDSSFQTSMRSVHGTERYMAPEQHAGFHEATAAADVYSFGCMLHDVFGDGEPRVPYRRHTAEGPLGPLIEACTETSLRDRLSSVAEVRSELRAALDDPRAEGGPYYDWAASLDSVGSWDASDAERFVHGVDRAEEDARERALGRLSRQALDRIHELSPRSWGPIARMFCDFVLAGQFHYSQADGPAGALWGVFSNGDADLRARAILATARLGSACNRYGVMKNLFEMADDGLEDGTAQRVAMEIRRKGLENDFRNCAGGIGRSVGGYHPRIAVAVGDG